MSLKKFLKEIFDINKSGHIELWEYIVIGTAILLIEIVAEITANLVLTGVLK